MPDESQWHLDKKVPITIIVALLVQTMGAVWWAATEDARVASLIAENVAQERRIDTLTSDMQSAKVAMAASSAQLSSIKEALDQLRQDQRETADLIRQALAASSK